MEQDVEFLDYEVEEEFKGIFSRELGKTFPSVRNLVENSLREKLKLGKKPVSDIFCGEIFLTPSNDVLYYYFTNAPGTIEIGFISLNGHGKSYYNNFKTIAESIIMANTDVEKPLKWEKLNPKRKHFDVLLEEISPCMEITDKDENIITLFRDKQLLELLTRVKKININEIKQNEDSLSKLEDLDLIIKEYTVYCQKTTGRISTHNSVKEIENSANMGFKCFFCGKPLSEEKIELKIEYTDLGLKYCKTNMFLTVNLIRDLIRSGISPENIGIKEFKNNEVVYVFVLFGNVLVQFGVFQDNINLEDTYLFLSSKRYYLSDVLSVYTDAEIPVHVNEYLKKNNDVIVINAMNNYTPDMTGAFHVAKKMQIAKMVEKLSPDLEFNLSENIWEYFGGSKLTPLEYVKPEISAPVKEVIEIEEDVPSSMREMEEEVSSSMREMEEEIQALPIKETEEEIFGGDIVSEELAEVGVTVEGEGPEIETIFTEDLAEDSYDIIQVETSKQSLDIEKIYLEISQFFGSDEILWDEIENRLKTLREKNYDFGVFTEEGLPVVGFSDLQNRDASFGPVSVEFHEVFSKYVKDLELGGIKNLELIGEAVISQVKSLPMGYLVLNTPFQRQFSEEIGFDVKSYDSQDREALIKKSITELMAIDAVLGVLISSREGLIIDYDNSKCQETNAEALVAVISQVVSECVPWIEAVKEDYINLKLISHFGEFDMLLQLLGKDAFLLVLINKDMPRDLWYDKADKESTILESSFK